MDFKTKLTNFAELTRMYALPMTFASLVVILSYSHYSENFSWLNFILLALALCLVHLGGNLFDDYIDVKRKINQGIEKKDISFFSFVPKARLILNDTFSFREVEIILGVMFLISLIIGLYFIFNSGWQIVLFILFGGLLTLFYPISSKYYLSEIIIGLIYGPLMICGGYFALTKEFSGNLLLLSFAIFFSTLVLLHTHNLMDWEFDQKEGKNTLCVLSKTKSRAIEVLKGLMIVAYFIIFLGVLSSKFNPYMLYVFLTLPIATKLLESLKDYINIKDVEFMPKWYYGVFENWDKIKENKIDFFMYRFYLARNFALFFAIFASIGAIL